MSPKIIHDKSFLRKICSDVQSVEEGEKIAQQLLQVLAEYDRGVGLSANQIGILKRVSVVKLPDESPLILMNPMITRRSNETVTYTEGCLSLPGKIVLTKRNLEVSITTLNHANELTFGPDIRPITKESLEKDFGLLKSVCIQHEIDHLNGKLITDPDIRVILPPVKSSVVHGRNDKVIIEKNGATQYIKYKRAIQLVETDGWKLI